MLNFWQFLKRTFSFTPLDFEAFKTGLEVRKKKAKQKKKQKEKQIKERKNQAQMARMLGLVFLDNGWWGISIFMHFLDKPLKGFTQFYRQPLYKTMVLVVSPRKGGRFLKDCTGLGSNL